MKKYLIIIFVSFVILSLMLKVYEASFNKEAAPVKFDIQKPHYSKSPNVFVQVKLSGKYNNVSDLSSIDQEFLTKHKNIKSVNMKIIKIIHNPENLLIPREIDSYVYPHDNIKLGEEFKLVLQNISNDPNVVNLIPGCGIKTSQMLAGWHAYD